MSPKFCRYSEWALLALIAVLFLTPLALTSWINSARSAPPWAAWLDHPWLRNKTLGGTQVKIEPAVLSARTVLSGSFQQNAAAQFNHGFAGRECLIHLTNEAWFRAFRETSNRASTMLLGRNNWVYEGAYLDEYFLKRPAKDELAATAENIRRLQDACAAVNLPFVFVITPSKAATYPEETPREWDSRYDPRPRAYDLMLELFREKGIRYVDGAAITRAAKARNESPAPLFPKGGIHWTEYTAMLTANAVLEQLREQGLRVQPLTPEKTVFTDIPEKGDLDILKVLNLAVQWRYPCVRVAVQQVALPESQRPSAAFIGGSFTWILMRMISESRQFSEIDAWFYYKLHKTCHVDGESREISRPVKSVDFAHEIFGADCLVLEMNEQTAPSPKHVDLFLKEALKNLPKPSVPREPFRYESYSPVQWGDRISFGKENAQPIRPAAMKRFAASEKDGTWTLGPEASIRFSVTKPEGDIVLRATVQSLLHQQHLPARSTTIFANGERVGEWSFSISNNQNVRQLVIPSRLVNESGRLVLRFETDHPISPRQLGLSDDGRELTLRFRDMRLLMLQGRFDMKQVPPDFMPCAWNERLSFRANDSKSIDPSGVSGFSSSEPDFTWTEGNRALIRLLTPPADGDIRFKADVAAFTEAEKLPSREARVFANDQYLGTWKFAGGQSTWRELTIPRGLIGANGELTLRFETAGGASLKSLGKGTDSRVLGLRFSAITLQAIQ